ncbi:hypothetical protein DRN51_07560, partial [Thermococci archaeon]
MRKKFKLDAGKILILIFLAYLVFLFWSMQTVRPPPRQVSEEEEELIAISEKLGFLNDNKLSEEEKEIATKIYPLYKYRTTLFDEVETDNPLLLANLSKQVAEVLEKVPIPLRDDMVRFLFSESPYTLEDFSNRVDIFKSQVNEFLRTYKKLPPKIRNGIENSQSIYQVKTLQ